MQPKRQARAATPIRGTTTTPWGGFTLIELVIVLVVIAILAAIAVPSYQAQIRKTRRADAVEAITRVQQAQEKYRASHTSYAGSLTTDLGFPASPLPSTDGHYNVALSSASATGYTVTATPVAGKPQASDTECASIVLTVAAGSISQTPAACWNR